MDAQDSLFVVEEQELLAITYRRLDEFPPDEALAGPDFDPRQLELLRHGLEHPISVSVDADNRITNVRDGRKRIKGLRKLGFDPGSEILTNQWKSTPAEDALATLYLNHARSSNPVTDFLFVHDLRRKYGYSEKEIAKQSGMTVAQVRSILALEGLEPGIMAGFIDGRVRPSAAYKIAKREPQEQRQLVAVLAENGTITNEDVQIVRKAGNASTMDAIQSALFDVPQRKVWGAWADGEHMTIVDPSGGRFELAADRFLEFLTQEAERKE